jgi:glucose 1-dehydrogenase
MLSPEAGHITGQTLVIDGGWTAVSPYPNSFDKLKNNVKGKRNPLSE